MGRRRSPLLLPSSGPLRRRQETPLHLAVREGALAIVANLLDKGANLTVRDRDGNTPLHYLFIEKRKLLESSLAAAKRAGDVGGNSKSSVEDGERESRLNFLSETIELILRSEVHKVSQS